MIQPFSLLLLSCSKRKLLTPGLLPAIERYDGPQIRLLRKFFRMNPKTNVEALILSTMFGIIPTSEPIPYYDEHMTIQRALELRQCVLETLGQRLRQKSYQNLIVSLGQDYQQAIIGIDSLLPSNCDLSYVRGSQGERLANLYRLLYGKGFIKENSHPHVRKTVRIRGVSIDLSPEQAFNEIRNILMHNTSYSSHSQVWYVDVDGRRVGVKWAVSQLSGLPVSTFGSVEARRVLGALGIEVHCE